MVEAIQLAQQATLETRDVKHEPRTLTEQRAAWREQAEDVLGGPVGVAAMVTTALSAGRSASATAAVDEAWVRDTAHRVRDEIASRRSTWQVWHVRGEAHRQVRAANLPAAQVEQVVDLVTDQTLALASVRLTPMGDGIEEPAELRRQDGSSVYEIAGSAVYTSEDILAAEQRLVHTAGLGDGHRASGDAVALALLEQAANGSASTPDRPPSSLAWRPRARTVRRRRGRPARADRRHYRHPRQAHLVPRPRRPAGLGPRHRCQDLGGDRRGWDG